MEKKVIKKMARFVELSAKFSKSDRDIFTEEELKTLNGNHYNDTNGTLYSGNDSLLTITSGGNVGIGTTTPSAKLNVMGNYSHAVDITGSLVLNGKEIYVNEKGILTTKDPDKPLTRGERLEANTVLVVKARAVLLDEYDEYIKLRTLLNNYFKGVDNLINE